MIAGSFRKGAGHLDRFLAWLTQDKKRSSSGSGWFRSLAVGAAFAAIGMLARLVSHQFYGELSGLSMLLPGAMLAALAAGWVGGLTALLLGLVGVSIWLLWPTGQLNEALFHVATFNYLLVGFFSVAVASSLRSAIQKLRCSAIQIDETEQRAAAALLSSTNEFKALVEQTSAGVARVSMDGDILTANARFADIIGVPLESLSASKMLDFTHPDDVAATHAIVDEVRAGRSEGGQVEKRYIRPDGEIVWAITSFRAIRNERGEPSGFISNIVDVTETRLAEAAAKQTENELRAMVDQASVGILRLSRDARILSANARFAELVGLTPEDCVGRATTDLTHPDDIGVTRDGYKAAAAGQSAQFEKRYVRPNGQIIWALVSLQVLVNDKDEAGGFIAIVTDITEARRAREALSAQERRQSFLLELSDRLRDLSGPEQIMTEVEQALGRLMNAHRVGYGEVDSNRRTVMMTHDWTSGVLTAQGHFALNAFGAGLMQDLAEGRTVAIPDVQHDERTREAADAFANIQTRALIRAPLIRNSQLRAFLYVHSASPREWTDSEVKLVEAVAARTWAEIERARAEIARADAEHQLAESETRFRIVADSAPAMIWMTDARGRIIFANRRFRIFFNVRDHGHLAAAWRRIAHHRDEPLFLTAFQRAYQARDRFEAQGRVVHPIMGLRWLRTEGVPRFDAAGRFQGYVGASIDITDAKKAETDLKRINELLEERVGEALAEKARAEADLMHAQRMEAVGRLTGGVAHDFNNLLTVVIGALDIILRSEDPAKRQKLGNAALSAARRGERLTHQLLAFSRRQTLRPENIDLNALIREGEPLLKKAVGETRLLTFKLRREPATVLVDPAQFEAALLNLTVNARDALSENGRITIQSTLRQLKIEEAHPLPPGAYVCISVQDDGEGIAPEIIDRVFEPFYTTKPVGKGTGLGLSQVYGFARQSGGDVRIRSQPGRGANVSILLPYVPSTRTQGNEDPVTTIAPSPDRTPRSLLLVEDDHDVALIAHDIIQGLGIRITTVSSASEALVELQTQRFDIMLTDIMMPGGMTGVELARICAASYPAMRILLTSGYAGDDFEDTLADAPWPLLRKPYSAEDLDTHLRSLSTPGELAASTVEP